MITALAQLEARLQALIEGSMARFFPLSASQPDESGLNSLGKALASRMVSAMQANVRLRSDGTIWAPNLFHLVVHPSQAHILQETPDLIAALAQELQRASSEGDFSFPSPPVIRVLPDVEVSLGEVHIQALFNQDHLVHTSSLEGKQQEAKKPLYPGGFLIIDGSQIYPLEASIVNIGRSSQNDLVLEDLRVSRRHAQLRLINGRYTIFDLDSSGGTFVNGQRVIQSILVPGDVISLAGVTLIFNQDSSMIFDETRPYSENEGEIPAGER